MHRYAHSTITRSLALAHLLGLFLPWSGIAATFEDWRAVHFNSTELADENISGPLADPEKDERPNLMEYAMGSDPKATDVGGTPFQINFGTSTQSLTFAEATGTEGLEWLFQSSGDLKHWITHNAVIEASRIPGSGLDTVTVDLPLPSGPPGKQFARIRLLHNETELLRSPNVVTPKALSGTSIQVEYSDTTPVETGFRIERRLPGATGWELVGTTASDVISFTDSDVSFTAGWEYRVIALGAGGTFVATEAFSVGNVVDTDQDGLPDSIELGSSYAGAPGTYPTDPNNPYSGGYGIPDGWFAANGFDPLNHDLTSDTDGDGLSDGEEAVLGLNPLNEDTDGDSVIDSLDGWGGAEDPLFEALLAPPRLPNVRYAVIEIGEGFPIRVNDVGQVLYADLAFSHWFWDAGELTELPASLPGVSFSDIYYVDMNNAGDVLGTIPTDWWADNENVNPPNTEAKAAKWNKTTGLTTVHVPYMINGKTESLLDMRGINDNSVIVGQQYELGYVVSDPQQGPDWSYDGWGSVKIDGGTVTQDFKIAQADGNIDVLDGFTSSGRIFYPNVIRNDGSTAGAFQEVHQGGSILNGGPITAVVIDGNGTEHELDGLEEVFDLTDDRHALAWDSIWNTHLSVHKNNVYHNRSMPGQSINNRMEVVSGSTIWRNFRTFELGDLIDGQEFLSINAVDINNGGAILADADGQVVLLLPIEIVYASGDQANKSIKSMPIFSPNDGTGKGMPVYSLPEEALSISLSGQLSSLNPDSISVVFLGATYQLTETGNATLQFEDVGQTIFVQVTAPLADPEVQETLTATVSLPSIGIANAIYICDETSADSNGFENTPMGLIASLSGLDTGSVDTISLTLYAASSRMTYELLETSANSRVFTSGNFTIAVLGSGSLTTAVETLDLSITYPARELDNTVVQVTETGAATNEFRNFNSPQLTNNPPEDVPAHASWRIRVPGDFPMTVKTSMSEIPLTLQPTSEPGIYESAESFVVVPESVTETELNGHKTLRAEYAQLDWSDPQKKEVTITVGGQNALSVKVQSDGVVLQSLDWVSKFGQGLDPEDRIRKPLESMGYTILHDYHAPAVKTKTDYVKNKQIWYSMSHGGTVDGTAHTQFVGLNFYDGSIVSSDLSPLSLNYRFVLVDGCSSAQTSTTSVADARASNTLTPGAQAFADAFGDKAAYLGWGWEQFSVNGVQLWSSEFVANLKGGSTVQSAFDKFQAVPGQPGRKEFKLYRNGSNVVDITVPSPSPAP